MKTWPALCVLLLVVTATPARAGSTRSLSAAYKGASMVYAGGTRNPAGIGDRCGDACATLVGDRCGQACVTFTVRRGERRARVTTSDASGSPVGWVATRGREFIMAGCGADQLLFRGGGEWFIAPAYVPGCQAPTVGELKVVISK